MKKTTKFYVVWKGRVPGVYDTWPECQEQVDQYVGGQYKSYPTIAEAKAAYTSGNQKEPVSFRTRVITSTEAAVPSAAKKKAQKPLRPISPALVVDAACSGVPGPVEWQGLLFGSGRAVFRSPLYPDGTNNIGEFLAIVDGIRWLLKEKLDLPLYSDSRNAILWVKNKKCKTTLKPSRKNGVLFKLIAEAETFLENADPKIRVLKWETEVWGENPADFGRK